MNVSVYLLILFLSMLTLLFVVETPVRAQVHMPDLAAFSPEAITPAASATSDDLVVETQVTAQVHKIEASAPADSATSNHNTSISDYAELGSALLVYLVLSLVLEMALTVVFNWRLFIKYLEGQGWKTPVAILFAAFIVWNFGLDVLRDVLNALGMQDCSDKGGCKQWEITTSGRVLTAFLLAGGNDAIFGIFTRLGIRNPFERKAEVLA
jgi:hypothetical protein